MKKTILNAAIALFSPVLLLPAFADSDRDAALREQCLARVDALHRCACNDVRENQPQDPAAFDLARPDLQAVYQDFKTSAHYRVEDDARLVAALKSAYKEQRELLSCHDRVGARTANFILTESYCVHEEAAARETGKPLCRTVGNEPIEAAVRAVKAQTEQYVGTFEKELQKLSYCAPNKFYPLENRETVAIEIPPCKIDLKSLFPDNQSVLTDDQAKKIVSHVKGHSCYKQFLQSGQTLQKVEILSSSSLLANSGAAANKSFLQLSEERAQEIESKIVRAILDPAAMSHLQFDKNARGRNGDGTTGACPYAYDSKRGNWFRKPFPTNAQLELNKKTELNFYYGEHFKQIDSDLHEDLMSVKCKSVRFFCR